MLTLLAALMWAFYGLIIKHLNANYPKGFFLWPPNLNASVTFYTSKI